MQRGSKKPAPKEEECLRAGEQYYILLFFWPQSSHKIYVCACECVCEFVGHDNLMRSLKQKLQSLNSVPQQPSSFAEDYRSIHSFI